jgi:predicted DNA-binding ribbon-helix-helix protein
MPQKWETPMLHATSLSQPLRRTNLYLSEFQRDSLKMLAKAEDISAAEFARRILDAGLRRATKNLASRQK